MTHYKVQTMARSFDGADRQNKADIQLMPDGGKLTLDLNALRKGQFYVVTLIDLDKAKDQPGDIVNPATKPQDVNPEIKPEPAFDPDDGTHGEPSGD